MLDWYIGECMVSRIDINNGIKEPTQLDQNCSTSQKLMLVGISRYENLYFRSVVLGSIPSKP